MRAGDRVRYGVTESGMLVVSPVALADLPEFTRAAAELADRLLVQRYGQRMLKHFEKFCVRCGKLYCAKSRSSRFCPVCRVHRQRVQSREYWLRKGKLTPSYHARLKNLPRARGKVETSEHRVADDTAAESTLGVTGVST